MDIRVDLQIPPSHNDMLTTPREGACLTEHIDIRNQLESGSQLQFFNDNRLGQGVTKQSCGFFKSWVRY